MAARIARIEGVFAAIGVLYRVARDSVPAWAHLSVLAGGIWIAFRLWEKDAGHGSRPTHSRILP